MSDYFTMTEELDRSFDAFSISSDKSKCLLCGAQVYPQDDWVPHTPMYNIEVGRFTFPSGGVMHEHCAIERDQDVTGLR